MHDLHCHILPGVDDGAPDLATSLTMVDAARAAGVSSLTATPHCRDPYFDYDAMRAAFAELAAACPDMPMQMGFEVSHHKLCELGLNWAPYLCLGESSTLLLELSVPASPSRFGDYERTIFALQGMGLNIIIAHPERYLAIQRDLRLAEELVAMGCKLQLSCDFIAGGRFGASRKPALRLLKEGLVSYLASDAHVPEHYALLAKAQRRYGHLLAE